MSERHLDTDVAIIGAGAAGVAAALEAKAAGARAVLLEQDDGLGGTAATSGVAQGEDVRFPRPRRAGGGIGIG